MSKKRNADSPPGQCGADQQVSDVYETGPRGGYTTHDIDYKKFWNELDDLLGRYGGCDVENDFRLRAHITDIKKEYHHHYMAIPNITSEMPMEQRLNILEKVRLNVNIAMDQLNWVLNDIRHLRYLPPEKK